MEIASEQLALAATRSHTASHARMPHTTVCSGELPIVHHTHAYLIHIIGCAISPFTSELELVLTVDRPSLGYNLKYWTRMQSKMDKPPLRIAANGARCELQWLSGSVRAVCPGVRAGDKLSGVWCPCIHHGLEAAEAAKRLDEKGRTSQCHTPAAGPGKSAL